ncbi:LacI family DNA-binding transcriptional regulator [Leptothrix discophora]|uniref:LacI family DNA-binding transcriptional regulator n=1 Tax=Leptothrix discophora TaxID=89 RepID=A0ABT9G178_LEPDI|nr:LacI family DNA-binding transcriptional regulator [Leptothrix discophora]MDP4300203.1 LacI family DNA-binding transcriptional regulator [Leptothrix discophora]
MATIHDVAQLAGVSIKTVSRVVNREPRISPETFEKVSRAIEMLGYEPHRGARLMRSGKSGLIGFITGLFSDIEVAKTRAGLSDLNILRGAQLACSAAGKTLLAADIGTGARPQTDSVAQLLKTFASHRVEGILYAAPYHQQVLLPAVKDTPLLLVNCHDLAGTPAVVPDDERGQARVVDHLVAQGHRRIGYIGVDENMVAGRLRKAAFLAACQRHGLDLDLCPARTGSDIRERDPFLPLLPALTQILQRPQRPTALCLGNDVMALQTIRELEALGIHVPGDIAVIGYDNDEVICEAARPRLSTVVLPYFEMGQLAVRRLLDLMAGQAPAGEVRSRVAGELVVRDSVPPLAAR